MKLNSVHSFQDFLLSQTQETIPPIVLVIAKDEYEGKEAYALFLKRFEELTNQKKEASICLKDSLCTVEKLEEALFSFSLFSSGKTLIVIEKQEAFKKEELGLFEKYLAHPSPRQALFIQVTSMAATSAIYKKIEAAGLILDIQEPKPWEKAAQLATWIQAYLKKEGKIISQDVAMLLAKDWAFDRSLLAQELEKLLTYAIDRKEITQKDLQAVSLAMPQKTVWQLSESVLQKNAAAALTILQNIVGELDTHPLVILRTLKNQFRNALILSSLAAHGTPHAEIATRFPQMKGKILERNLSMATSFGSKALIHAQLLLDDAEQKLKNSSTDPLLVLQMLFVSIANIK